jgi:hypothetical protein
VKPGCEFEAKRQQVFGVVEPIEPHRDIGEDAHCRHIGWLPAQQCPAEVFGDTQIAREQGIGGSDQLKIAGGK